MSGFQTGNSQGIVSTGKKFGSILRGYGPPVPAMGVLGDLYIDVNNFQLFQRRSVEGLDPWGHYLFVVPAAYQTTLRFFGTSLPPSDLGIVGDYYMQFGGFPSYGMDPIIFGPKAWSGWPENGDGPGTVISGSGGGAILSIGISAEGASLTDQQLSQLLAIGITAELAIPVPVTANPGDPVLQLGIQSNGVLVTVTPNTLYTAEDEKAL